MNCSDILGLLGITVSVVGVIISLKIYNRQLVNDERNISFNISLLDASNLSNNKLNQYLNELIQLIDYQCRILLYKRPLEYMFVLRNLNRFMQQEIGTCIMYNNYVEVNKKELKDIVNDTKKLFGICQQLVAENHATITNEVSYSMLKIKGSSFVRNIHSYITIVQQLKCLESDDELKKLDKYCFSYLFDSKTNSIAKKILHCMLIISDKRHNSYFIRK